MVLESIATGPFVAACALLGVAGVAKLRDPRPVQLALQRAGLRRAGGSPGRIGARVLGGVELALAIGGVLVGGALAAAVGVAYAGLAVFALVLMRRAPGAGCGCLGDTAAPVSGGHVALDTAAAVCAFAVAAGAAPIDVLRDQPLGGIPFVVLVLVCARLGALVMDALPILRAASASGTALEGGR